MKLDLNFVLNMFGGIPGLVASAVLQLTHGKLNLTASSIDSSADRMLTISEHDHRAACARLGIKDEEKIVHLLGLARIAGDKMGDYAAGMAEEAAHITH